jgi:undecaprenyl-phosphate 4-deoxy-4-formamido-L-arabinose transferase
VSDPVQLSIVIPMYNEERNIPALAERLLAACRDLPFRWEVVCVNDGSRDRTPALVRELVARHPQFVLVDFARNFGQHAAVSAGFAHSRGEWIITLDADLQNPPEEIPSLVRQFQAGHDLINTVRQNRQDTVFRKTASKITNALVRKLSGIRLNDFGCMLRGYHRDVARRVVACREYKTFIPALASLFACRPVEVPVGHAERAQGESKYPFRKLLSLQLDLITNFSVQPLRLLFVAGILFSVLGMLVGLGLIAARLVMGPEWANQGTLTVLGGLIFLSGAQFFAFGLLGEYIGRIFQQVRLREPWFVASIERSGQDPERPAAEPAGG